MSKPFVSIVMPVFNTGAYLNEAVESVLKQEGCSAQEISFELLIVDDHSTDLETIDILQKLRSVDTRIRVISNMRKKGASGARNTGITEARGDWIGFLDSDDWFLPNAIAAHQKLIAAEPSAQWIAGLMLVHSEGAIDRSPLSIRAPNLYDAIKEGFDKKEATQLVKPVAPFARNCFCTPSSVFIRKHLIMAKGMFDESLIRAEDYYLWFRCAVDTDLWVIPHEVFVYRARPGSLTMSDEPMFYREHQVMDRLLDDPMFEPHKQLLKKRLDLVMADYCHFYRAKAEFTTARRWAAFWMRRRPLQARAWKQWIASCIRRR